MKYPTKDEGGSATYYKFQELLDAYTNACDHVNFEMHPSNIAEEEDTAYQLALAAADTAHEALVAYVNSYCSETVAEKLWSIIKSTRAAAKDRVKPDIAA